MIKTVGYNGSVPGPILRFKEGKPINIEVFNDTEIPETVHWHGMQIPSAVDGSVEEGTPEVPAKAVLARIVPPERRSTAFGVFDRGFAVVWFAGSAAMGLLSKRSILAVVLFSSLLQLAALPVRT